MRLRVTYLRPHRASTDPRDERLDIVDLDGDASKVEALKAQVADLTGDVVLEIDDVVPLRLVEYDVEIRRVPVPFPTRPTVELRTVQAYAPDADIGDDTEAWARRRAGRTYLGLHTADDGRHAEETTDA